MGTPLETIRDIYERWLEGRLAQEDALFAIGDVLRGQEAAPGPDPARAPPAPASSGQDS